VENDEKSSLENETPALPFEGNWTRSFQLGEGADSLQYVYYNIYTDSIQYIMKGPLPLNYNLIRDTFLLKENRWVGKLNDVYFAIFVKAINADTIALFKQQFPTREEALNRPYPADTVSGHFSSWYNYYRNN